MRCANCGHVRTRFDALPDTQCPRCGMQYAASERNAQLGLSRHVLDDQSAAGTRKSGTGLGSVVIALLLAGFGGGWYLLRDFGMPEQREPAPTMKGSIPSTAQPQVVMYATSWCPYCAKTRAFFKKHGIVYTEYDVEREDKRDSEYKSMGGRGVPFIRIGNETVRGFDEPALTQLLEPWFRNKT
jgi:mycoredoxin